MTHLIPAPVGAQLRQWRTRRQLSQLALALHADVSTRHLSCVETGRSVPSREMILRLADRLEVPLRERNRLLTAAGFAPMFAARPLDDPEMAPAHDALRLLLQAHEPFPALVVDRHWHLLLHNRAVPLLLEQVPAVLLQPPLNVLRLSLHPEGLAPRIVNHAAWRGHVLHRLRQQVAVSGDETLRALEAELAAYPTPEGSVGATAAHRVEPGPVVPLVIDTTLGRLSFMSTTTVFGTPVDVTLAELALETFLQADAATAAALRRALAEAPLAAA